MRKIVEYILETIPYMLIFLPIMIGFRAIKIKKMKLDGKNTTIFHECGVVLLTIFLIGLASQTILPDDNWKGVMPMADALKRANFELFKVIPQTYHIAFKLGVTSYFTINFLGNIVMFMPVGIMLPLLWRRWNMIRVVGVGLLMSLFIEFSQLFINRGTDVDDLWLNTLGVLLGYIVYVIIKKTAPAFVLKFKMED